MQSRGRGEPALHHRVRRTEPFAVVQLSGVLDRRSAEDLPGILGGYLIDQPAALVIDISGLRVRDPTAIFRLTEFAGRADQWPGTTVVVCGARPEVVEALGHGAPTDAVPVYPDVRAAAAKFEGVAVLPRLTAALPPVVVAARHAREMVADACERWRLPALVGPACIAVTELANNAVVHARTPMEIILGVRGRRLTVAVHDRSDVPPRMRGPITPSAPGGRGLVMVDAVAERWGWTPVAGGKVVWAVVAEARTGGRNGVESSDA